MTSPSASLPVGVHKVSSLPAGPLFTPLARTWFAVLGDNQRRQVVDVGQEGVIECAEKAGSVASGRLAKGGEGGGSGANRLFDVAGVHLRRLGHRLTCAGVCRVGQ